MAAGTAVGEAPGGLLQVDAGYVGDAGQPSEGVAQLVLHRGRVVLPERLGDLADLLDPPAEGAVDPACAVARPEGRLDRGLQVAEFHDDHSTRLDRIEAHRLHGQRFESLLRRPAKPVVMRDPQGFELAVDRVGETIGGVGVNDLGGKATEGLQRPQPRPASDTDSRQEGGDLLVARQKRGGRGGMPVVGLEPAEQGW